MIDQILLRITIVLFLELIINFICLSRLFSQLCSKNLKHCQNHPSSNEQEKKLRCHTRAPDIL